MPSQPPDWNAEEDGAWLPDAKATGQLCLAKDEAGAPQPRLGKAIDKAIAEAQVRVGLGLGLGPLLRRRRPPRRP